MNAHDAVKIAEAALLTVDQVARQCRVHRNTVYRAARLGFLKGQRVGRLWRFHPVDVEEWVAEGGRSQ